jgi:hypothetical protein
LLPPKNDVFAGFLSNFVRTDDILLLQGERKMKILLSVLTTMLLISQTEAATHTVNSDAIVDSRQYHRTIYISGTYRLHTSKNGVNLRLMNSNLATRQGHDLVVAFDGLELLDLMARNPVKFGDRLLIKAQCNGVHSVTYLRGLFIGLYGGTCKIRSLTVTTDDVAPQPAPVYVAPQPAPVYVAPQPAPVYVAPIYTRPSYEGYSNRIVTHQME